MFLKCFVLCYISGVIDDALYIYVYVCECSLNRFVRCSFRRFRNDGLRKLFGRLIKTLMKDVKDDLIFFFLVENVSFNK